MLVRLWESEQPRAVLVGWDTLEVPTYRHEAFDAATRAGACSTPSCSSSSPLPELVEALGFAAAKAPGYEADDFLAAAVAARGSARRRRSSSRRTATRSSSRATARRSSRRPAASASSPESGPDEVRERYGVEPKQVPDFIALRGDPSDKLPGAPGIGPKKAAEILRSTARSRRARRPDASPRRRRNFASTGE